MKGLQHFVKRLVKSLTLEGVDYAFTGALAASFYGVPRTIADIDVLVAVSAMDVKTIASLVAALRKAGLEVQEKKIADALASGCGVATYYAKDMPYKVDVILTSRIYKREGEVGGVAAFIQSPENLISAKLLMIKARAQDTKRALKDEEDIISILRFTIIDRKAVSLQAEKDKTTAIWRRLAG